MCANYYISNKQVSIAFFEYKSPFQLLFDKEPSYQHLKSFGCLCYAVNHAPGRTKFDSRSQPCIFIGYPFGKKAYKLYDLTTRTVLSSKDVTFHKSCYPFHHVSLPTNSPLLVADNEFPTSICYPTIHVTQYPTSKSVSSRAHTYA
ncbi:hypothetical protein LIER_42558 [Lithospermum erythrorhizon]|uniref:Retroviral polymerase SH3-like domain-containing protein n=1 Tax=Lithospermum erythrorhizon TaxID=34254 RepID=A0AAV3NHY1_LITER